MVTELRWILLGLSVVLLGGIWWWGARRARQSPKHTEWRETAAAQASEPAGDAPAIRAEDQTREWGVPPFEPLSIRTADFDQVEMIDLPMTSTSDPFDVTLNMDHVAHESAAAEHAPSDEHPEFHLHGRADEAEIELDLGLDLDLGGERGMGLGPEIGLELDDVLDRSEGRGREPHVTFEEPPAAPLPRAAPQPAATVERAPPQTPNASETQRIVTIRVSAEGESRWSGSDLLAALEAHGLGFGRYKVFHRKHTDGRTLFCAASLVEPGTFDIARMPHEEFRGLTLFAVLPGPADPLYTMDALMATAGDLAEALDGSVQDSNGAPLSPQRAEAMREEVARLELVGHGRAGQAE